MQIWSFVTVVYLIPIPHYDGRHISYHPEGETMLHDLENRGKRTTKSALFVVLMIVRKLSRLLIFYRIIRKTVA